MDTDRFETVALTPYPGELEEAKRFPDGWIYRIAGNFGNGSVPPEAIIGAWKVDSKGAIVGDFIKNPNYDRVRWPAKEPERC